MVELGLRTEEFWRLTPYELTLLQRRRDAAERRAWQRTAALCAVIANRFRSRKEKRAYRVEDFMPRTERPRRMSPAEQYAVIRQLHEGLTGESA